MGLSRLRHPHLFFFSLVLPAYICTLIVAVSTFSPSVSKPNIQEPETTASTTKKDSSRPMRDVDFDSEDLNGDFNKTIIVVNLRSEAASSRRIPSSGHTSSQPLNPPGSLKRHYEFSRSGNFTHIPSTAQPSYYPYAVNHYHVPSYSPPPQYSPEGLTSVASGASTLPAPHVSFPANTTSRNRQYSKPAPTLVHSRHSLKQSQSKPSSAPRPKDDFNHTHSQTGARIKHILNVPIAPQHSKRLSLIWEKKERVLRLYGPLHDGHAQENLEPNSEIVEEFYKSLGAFIEVLPYSGRSRNPVRDLKKQLEDKLPYLNPRNFDKVQKFPCDRYRIILENTRALVKEVWDLIDDLSHRQPPIDVRKNRLVDDDCASTFSFRTDAYDLLSDTEFKDRFPVELNGACASRYKPLPSVFEPRVVDYAERWISVIKQPLSIRPETTPVLKQVQGRKMGKQSGCTPTLYEYRPLSVPVKKSPVVNTDSQITLVDTKHQDTDDVKYSADGKPKAMSVTAILDKMVMNQGKRDNVGKTQIGRDEEIGEFEYVVLTCFRYWMKPEDFAIDLINAYHKASDDNRKQDVLQVVDLWVQSFWTQDDMPALLWIQQFIEKISKSEYLKFPHNRIVKKTKKKLEELTFDEVPSKNHHYEKEHISHYSFLDNGRNLSLKEERFCEIHLTNFASARGCQEFAEQLTLLESELFLKLDPREFISFYISLQNKPEAKEKTKEKTENKHETIKDKLAEQCKFGNSLKLYTTHSILFQENPRKRAEFLVFWTNICMICLEKRNFSSAFSIYNGICSCNLENLNLTIREVPCQTQANLEELRKFFVYRWENAVPIVAEPTVPNFAMYAGRLERLVATMKAFIQPELSQKSLVNVAMFRMATNAVQDMRLSQHPYREVKIHEQIQKYIMYLQSSVLTGDNKTNDVDIYKRYTIVKEEEKENAQEKQLKQRRIFRR